MLLSDDGVFSVIVPSEVLEVVVSEACMLGFYLIGQCGVKTVERKQPKRYLLSFAKHRYNGMENTIKTMTDSEGNRSEWYAKNYRRILCRVGARDSAFSVRAY